MTHRSCVHPAGHFSHGLHKPSYTVANLRENDFLGPLGVLSDGSPYLNSANFPDGAVEVAQADWIYEIANPFPFRGATFICKSWAESRACDPAAIRLPDPPSVSMHQALERICPSRDARERGAQFRVLPETVLLTLAATSTDPEDLVLLAKLCCDPLPGEGGEPAGLRYEKDENGRPRPRIRNHDLFEALVNNIHLPDAYKRVMVLRPGVQGGSEIVGEFSGSGSHIFEYLRRNSYIPWGHYAANMADDAIRYRTAELSLTDMRGLRHLYYQRTYFRLAEQLSLPLPDPRKAMTESELESLRKRIMVALARQDAAPLPFNATLWGWNYGFDFAASGYRLHASHQQIHQQFAMLPREVPLWRHGELSTDETMPSYGCGDLIADFTERYRQENGRPFFSAYLAAIRGNRRMDGKKNGNDSLIVHEDENVMLFVPKAQTSQWELQIMTVKETGNILEADATTRASLDKALLIGQQILAALGARLVTSIEFAKRIDNPDRDQRLLYALLPKLPHSMGAFSEAQLRWINGHFPEDFAAACRLKLPEALAKID
ncbi:hypothetical protein ACUUL3_10070 [Thiovibrio sp. JS02]